MRERRAHEVLDLVHARSRTVDLPLELLALLERGSHQGCADRLGSTRRRVREQMVELDAERLLVGPRVLHMLSHQHEPVMEPLGRLLALVVCRIERFACRLEIQAHQRRPSLSLGSSS